MTHSTSQLSDRLYHLFQALPTEVQQQFLENLAVTALKQELGIAATLRFLALISHNSTDYVEISHQLYEGQELDEVFTRAKQNWKA